MGGGTAFKWMDARTRSSYRSVGFSDRSVNCLPSIRWKGELFVVGLSLLLLQPGEFLSAEVSKGNGSLQVRSQRLARVDVTDGTQNTYGGLEYRYSISSVASFGRVHRRSSHLRGSPFG
jgi:hypothetical protein